MGKILDIWQSSATQTHITSILPDGCRDLICSQRRGKYPEWFISDLQSGSNNSRMESRDYMAGFRLPPGTVINETDLLQTLGKMDPDTAKITAILQDHIHQCPDVTSILTHLARCRGTAAKAAGDLNIHPRQLHRLLAGATGRGAGFWLQLARARTAGREILGGGDHAGIAAENGYADQSHMVRDMQKWFALSPTALSGDSSFAVQLSSGGFA